MHVARLLEGAEDGRGARLGCFGEERRAVVRWPVECRGGEGQCYTGAEWTSASCEGFGEQFDDLFEYLWVVFSTLGLLSKYNTSDLRSQLRRIVSQADPTMATNVSRVMQDEHEC